jgi:glycosyltransferase involved in cell wall biosynthesis
MVSISCSGKFHAFALAEQMEKHALLDGFYTSYAYQKNTFLRRFVKRMDKEAIPIEKIHTNSLLAFPIKLLPGSGYTWLNLFDNWVASKMQKSKSKIFIGWSGMSLQSIKAAKSSGKITILERGSSHIVYQNQILEEEHRKLGISFEIDRKIIAKELQEYKAADYISVPSFFVKDSFIQHGVPESKLFMNPYGVGLAFSADPFSPEKTKRPFRIVYMGTLSIRKGLIYLFEALKQLSIAACDYEVWFIGSIDKSMEKFIAEYRQDNWTFFGHIDHYKLKQYLLQCDVGIQPSLEEGLSMVIPQLMASGIPMIVTPNSGGENIITDGVNGFVVPIRNPFAIAEKIQTFYFDRDKLAVISKNALASIQNSFTWDAYGDRYSYFINKLNSQL